MKIMINTQNRVLQECLQALARGEALEDILRRCPQQAAALRPRLQAAAWLTQHARYMQPRPGWLPASKARLLADLHRQSTPRSQAWRGFCARLRVVRLGIQAVLIVLLALSFINVTYQVPRVAKFALPGDFFYPAKLGFEQLRLVFNFSSPRDAQYQVLLTQQRTLELQELLLEGRYEQLAAAVVYFEKQFRSTQHTLKILARSEPQLAQNMQSQLQHMIQDQAFIISLLAKGTPNGWQANLDQAFLVAPR